MLFVKYISVVWLAHVRSEIMVTFVFIIVLFNSIVIILIFVLCALFLVRVIILLLEVSRCLMFAWFPFILCESILGLSHLVVSSSELGIFIIFIIAENLFFFSYNLSSLVYANDLLLLLSSLRVFQVVHVKFVFQVVNVTEFFNVNSVESLQLGLKSFVFLLILWLHVLYTFESFFSAFKLLLSPG